MRSVRLSVLCAVLAMIVVGACGDDDLSAGELHARLHDVAGEACDEIEAGGAADAAITKAIEEAAEFGASEQDAREILQETCPELLSSAAGSASWSR